MEKLFRRFLAVPIVVGLFFLIGIGFERYVWLSETAGASPNHALSFSISIFLLVVYHAGALYSYSVGRHLHQWEWEPLIDRFITWYGVLAVALPTAFTVVLWVFGGMITGVDLAVGWFGQVPGFIWFYVVVVAGVSAFYFWVLLPLYRRFIKGERVAKSSSFAEYLGLEVSSGSSPSSRKAATKRNWPLLWSLWVGSIVHTGYEHSFYLFKFCHGLRCSLSFPFDDFLGRTLYWLMLLVLSALSVYWCLLWKLELVDLPSFIRRWFRRPR